VTAKAYFTSKKQTIHISFESLWNKDDQNTTFILI